MVGRTTRWATPRSRHPPGPPRTGRRVRVGRVPVRPRRRGSRRWGSRRWGEGHRSPPSPGRYGASRPSSAYSPTRPGAGRSSGSSTGLGGRRQRRRGRIRGRRRVALRRRRRVRPYRRRAVGDGGLSVTGLGVSGRGVPGRGVRGVPRSGVPRCGVPRPVSALRSRTGVGPGRVDGAPRESPDDDSGDRGAEQERPRAAAGERPHLVEEVAGLSLAQPVGEAVGPVGGLPRDLRHRPRLLPALDHPAQFLAQRPDAVGGLLLARAGLVLDLAAGLTDEVAGLGLHLLRHVRGLIGGRPRHLPSGVGRRAADLCGLVPSYLRGRLPVREPDAGEAG